jgi:hypothetical protein
MVVYLQPLLQIRDEVVPRELGEAGVYSAMLDSYLATPPGNRLYGELTSGVGGPELRLFPGLTAIVFAIGALLRPRRTSLVYLGLLIVAMIASMGVNAPFFRAMRWASELVTMLRVPARFAAVFLCALGVLAATGAAAFFATLASRRTRAIAVVAIAAVMLAEYSTVLRLEEVHPPSPVHRYLASQPRGAVAELPMPEINSLPGNDAQREYYSTFHWQPLLNGYSGYYPISHNALLFYLETFPRGSWIDLLIGRGARYFVVHEREFRPPVLANVLRRMEADPRLRRIARFPDPYDPSWIYERVK